MSDVRVNLGERSYDVRIGPGLLRAAGAEITDVTGTPYELGEGEDPERRELLGSNGALHSALVEHLSSQSALQRTEDD